MAEREYLSYFALALFLFLCGLKTDRTFGTRRHTSGRGGYGNTSATAGTGGYDTQAPTHAAGEHHAFASGRGGIGNIQNGD